MQHDGRGRRGKIRMKFETGRKGEGAVRLVGTTPVGNGPLAADQKVYPRPASRRRSFSLRPGAGSER